MNNYLLYGPLPGMLFKFLVWECVEKGFVFETDKGFKVPAEVKEFVQTQVNKHDIFSAMYDAHEEVFGNGIDDDFCTIVMAEILSTRWGDPNIYLADLKL